MGTKEWLNAQGLTNSSSEDYGSIATGLSQQRYYDFYCTSDQCCTYESEGKWIENSKSGQREYHRKFKRREKTHKALTTKFLKLCPDCGHPLTSVRC